MMSNDESNYFTNENYYSNTSGFSQIASLELKDFLSVLPAPKF